MLFRSKPLEVKKLSIRLWVNQDSNLDSELTYHGLIQVIEKDHSIAIAS